MIPNSLRNRALVWVLITLVSSIAPLSVLFTAAVVFFNPISFKNPTQIVLLSWCAMESLFYAWSFLRCTYRHRSEEIVVPSFEMRRKLKADTFQTVGTSGESWRQFIEGWFRKRNGTARLEDIRKENLAEWISWAYFANTKEDVLANDEWRDELLHVVEELCDQIQKWCPGVTIADGFNPDVRCIKLTLDAIRSNHRPLAFYAVVYLLQSCTSLFLRYHGYSYCSGIKPTENIRPVLGYWYKAPSYPTSSLPPIVIVHGIGSVISLTWFISLVAQRDAHRHVFVMEVKDVSMLLPRPTAFLSPLTISSQIYDMIDLHIPPENGERSKAVLFGHSLGAIFLVWVLEFAPERVAALVLCDPISLLLQYSDVAHNFVYRRGSTAAEIFFEWISREPGIAFTLARHFHWFQNVFPIIPNETDPSDPQLFPRHIPTSIFLSEVDCIVPSSRISSFLGQGKKGNVEVEVMKGLDHGSFLFDKRWLNRVANTLVRISGDEYQ